MRGTASTSSPDKKKIVPIWEIWLNWLAMIVPDTIGLTLSPSNGGYSHFNILVQRGNLKLLDAANVGNRYLYPNLSREQEVQPPCEYKPHNG